LLRRVLALPGVHSASIADAALLSSIGSYVDGVTVEGASTQEPVEGSLRVVGPRFFETMGIPIRLGREFSSDDRATAAAGSGAAGAPSTGSHRVAIINETFARTYFAGKSPIGKHVGVGGADRQIVGVIADTKYRNLRESTAHTVFMPIDQAAGELHTGGERTLHVRTTFGLDPASIAAAVREQVRALDKNLPVEISLFSNLVDENLAQERLIAVLSGFFAGLALLLTATGLYGVIAYNVQRRTREIGIRMSLGAQRGEVLWMVLRDCMVLAGLGVAVGVPVSLWLSGFVARQLFGISPGDAGTIAGAAGCLVAVAAMAGYLPARRASRVDPMVALRHDSQ
jgi:predicted permease